MTPRFFATQADFRAWLEINHEKETELLVGFYKVGSGQPSLTWPQSVDEALCFGWIDGIRRSIDANSYCIRFTPRKSTSIWSAVNIQKVENLTQQGLIRPAGLAAFAKRAENKSRVYAYEQEKVNLSDELINAFKANEQAWNFFQKQAPSYQKRAINWVMTARQLTTKLNRFQKLVKDSESARKI